MVHVKQLSSFTVGDVSVNDSLVLEFYPNVSALNDADSTDVDNTLTLTFNTTFYLRYIKPGRY